jgi:hypothetical protein
LAVFWEAKPCHLVRSNMSWSYLVPSATCSWSQRRQLMLHFLILRNVPTECITAQKFWISSNTIFKNPVYGRRGCLIWSISKFKYIVVLWAVSLFIFVFGKQCFFLQCSWMLECLILKINVKLEVLFRSVGLNLYLKCRRSLVFRNVRELLPD